MKCNLGVLYFDLNIKSFQKKGGGQKDSMAIPLACDVLLVVLAGLALLPI